MNRLSIFSLTLTLLLSGCSFMGGDKDKKKLVADGLTPKELYEQAEDKVDSGLVEQAIDQYEMILTSYPGSKYAIQARLDIAYNLLKQNLISLEWHILIQDMMIRLSHIGQWLARSVHYLPYPQLVHIILLELSHQQQAFFYHYRRP